MIPTLRTKRLVLRAAVVADAPAMARYLNNFAVVSNLARVPYPYGLADAERWLHSVAIAPPPEETGFAIELPGAGYVGHIGFHLEPGGVNLGYWLGEPFWHRGLMTEAVRATVGWYFETTDAAGLCSGVFHFNKASLAIQKKLGFIETGTSVRHCLARGEQVRHIDTLLSRAAWAGASA